MFRYQLIIEIDGVNYKYFTYADTPSLAMLKTLVELEEEIGSECEIKIKLTRKIKE